MRPMEHSNTLSLSMSISSLQANVGGMGLWAGGVGCGTRGRRFSLEGGGGEFLWEEEQEDEEEFITRR